MIQLYTSTVIGTTLCIIGPISAARGGLWLARATDKHLVYPTVSLGVIPASIGVAIAYTAMIAAPRASLALNWGDILCAILLGAIGAADARRHVIPEVLVGSFALLGVIAHPLDPFATWPALLGQAALAYFAGLIVIYVCQRRGRSIPMGRGDLAMMAAISANVSLMSVPIILLGASVSAATFWVVFKRNREAWIPLGPFLALSSAAFPSLGILQWA